MRIHHLSLTLLLIGMQFGCSARQGPSPDTGSNPETAATPAADPMASFARMPGGEWRRPALTRADMFHTWYWGPGRHSMLAQAYGSGAAGEPWRELEVYYWHPGRRQVALLGLSPFARGVSEGTIQFVGESADAVFDLYQTAGRRTMGLHWSFSGPDNYHAVLLEATGPEGLKPMNEWDVVRLPPATATRTPNTVPAPSPSGFLVAFEPLLGRTWEAKGEWPSGDAYHLQSSFEWIPYADAIYGRTLTRAKSGQSTPLVDTVFYHHTGTGRLRCLALSEWGGVYEGDVTVLADGDLQLDLEAYENDRSARQVVRFDLEEDGALHLRVSSAEDTDPRLLFDIHFEARAPRLGDRTGDALETGEPR